MRYAVPAFVSALAIAIMLQASPGHAQVVISGQVTSYTTPTGTTPPASGSSYVAGDPAPTRYIHRSENVPALWIPGLIGLIGGYGLNLVGLSWALEGQIDGYYPSGDWYLLGIVPIAGPWLQIALTSDGVVMPIITGILQGAGLIMTILGFAITTEWDEPVYVFNESDPMSPRLSFNVDTAPGGGAIGTATLTHF